MRKKCLCRGGPQGLKKRDIEMTSFMNVPKAFGQRPIDGWLYGTSRYLRPGQDEPEFSGPDIAYIYENFDIAIRGHFYQGVMLNATAAKISAFR